MSVLTYVIALDDDADDAAGARKIKKSFFCQFDADARKLGGGRMSVLTYVIALDDDADDAAGAK